MPYQTVSVLEPCPPPLEEGESFLFKYVHRGWGTAIPSRGLALEEIPIDRYPGRVVAARTLRDSGEELRVASVHAPLIGNRVFPHLSITVVPLRAYPKIIRR